MIALHRDPRGTTLFKGHIIVSSSEDLSKENHMQEIEILRKRIRELETLFNQPDHQTKSQHEVESINPCYQQEGDKRVSVHLVGKEPINDDVASTETIPPGGEICADGQDKGDECSETTKEELSTN